MSMVFTAKPSVILQYLVKNIFIIYFSSILIILSVKLRFKQPVKLPLPLCFILRYFYVQTEKKVLYFIHSNKINDVNNHDFFASHNTFYVVTYLFRLIHGHKKIIQSRFASFRERKTRKIINIQDGNFCGVQVCAAHTHTTLI